MEYLRDNNILYKYQYGFCKNYSTDASLLYLTNKIMTGFYSGILTEMILIDLQKQKLNKTGSLNIRRGTTQIKQYHTVTSLGCALDENLFGKTMALKVISKINCRLRFFYR